MARYHLKQSLQEVLKEKGSAFRNQKQLRFGGRLSGSKWIDNRIDIDDTEDNLDFRMSEPAGSPFMHPMHDATADSRRDSDDAIERKRN